VSDNNEVGEPCELEEIEDSDRDNTVAGAVKVEMDCLEEVSRPTGGAELWLGVGT
jgi:hypothetical protein